MGLKSLIPKRNNILYFNPPTPHGVGRAEFEKTLLPNFNFNPPTPHGVGLVSSVFSFPINLFQSTHPAWGGTGKTQTEIRRLMQISIHPPRMGWDRQGDGVLPF